MSVQLDKGTLSPAAPSRSRRPLDLRDLPYDVLMLCAQFALVREVLLLGTLNRHFRQFCSSSNVALWTLFTERVCLLHPPSMRRTLFNGPILRMYAAVNPLPTSRIVSPETDVELNPLPLGIISISDLAQWVTDRTEEVIQDVRMFSDIVKATEPRLALSGLLMALQAVKKRMWDTEVTDLESVRDLLRATIVEKEHDRGWSVLRTVVGHEGIMPKQFLMPLSASPQSPDTAGLRAEHRLWRKRWRRLAEVAREYLQLREVLRVVLAVSEVSDHPKAKERYDSVWSALQGTSAMLKAEKRPQQSPPEDLDEVGAAIPIKEGAAGDELLHQVRELNTVTVGGIVSYYFGCVSGKAQRKAFLSALFSMKHLAGAARYENVPYW